MAQDTGITSAMPAPAGPAQTGTVLSVRLTIEERAKLEAAAELSHASLSDFVRRTVMEAAELAIMDQRLVTIPAEKWDEFEAWLSRPPEPNPALEELFRRTEPTWKRHTSAGGG